MAKRPRPLIDRGSYFEVPLSNGDVAWISPESYEAVRGFCWTGHALGSQTTYAYRKCRKKNVYLHRWVVESAGFEIADDEDIDHINNNGLDNRLTNLRIASRALNARNRRQRTREPILYYSARLDRWRATVQVTVPLGVYTTRDAAVKAYEAWLEDQLNSVHSVV